MLKAVMRNLVSNAIKFTNTGGTIIISAEQTQSDVIILVSDSGIGIPPKNLAKLFEISEVLTTKGTSNETGTGFGLLICKEFIEKHSGKIWVESEVGRGSNFRFTLPCITVSKDKKVIGNAVSVKDEGVGRKDLKILVVDDDEASHLFLKEALQESNNEVIHASTGVEAIEACRNNPRIDLVLMDIRMPEMDGYEATRQIRLFNTEVIIIAQTAYAFAVDIEKAIEAGCNDYISKPINMTLLHELIKKHCNN
jgi:CheY-like chemotaxis protein